MSESWIAQLSSAQLQSLSAQLGGVVIQDGDAASNLHGTAGSDLIFGEDGSDSISGGSGHDLISGGSGSDLLYGGEGNDLLLGGEGNDRLDGDGGDDILEGGAGNDRLSGGTGSDIYRFSRGWGQDTIDNYDWVSGKTDAIVFADDIASSDITISRSSDDLVLGLKGSTDRITVSNYFYQDGHPNYTLEEIRFADGTTWTVEQVKQWILQSTDNNDVIRGYATDDSLSGGLGHDEIFGRAGNDVLDGGAGDDTLYGEAGNDTVKGGAGNDVLYGGEGNDLLLGGEGNEDLYGESGNDTVKGGAGNDVLYGGEGNDLLLGGEGNDTLYGEGGDHILEGGAGNDYLSGGVGSDIYRFARGWGQDTINNYDTSTGKTDAIEFGSDIASSDVTVSRSSTDLILSLKGSTDRVTVSNYFSNGGASIYKLEQIRFADGKSWSIEQVKVMALQSTDGNDTLTGYATDDVLSGGLGNDFLYGGNGNDTLRGGWGNDTLTGGLGDDTYLFAIGDGRDVINNASATAAADNDILRFEGISRDSLWFSRQGSNLVIDIMGAQDSVIVQSWYSSANQQLDAIQAGSSSLYANQVDNLVNAMAAFGAPAGGETNLTQAQRDQLNVVIAADWQ